MDIKFAEGLEPYGHWLPRFAFAGVFLFHGLTKFPAAQGLAQMMGMPTMAIYLIAAMETLGGVLVLYGGTGKDWAKRLGGLLIVPVMLGAIAMVHWPQWSFVASATKPMGGMEFQTMLLALGFYFFLKGNKTV